MLSPESSSRSDGVEKQWFMILRLSISRVDRLNHRYQFLAIILCGIQFADLLLQFFQFQPKDVVPFTTFPEDPGQDLSQV